MTAIATGSVKDESGHQVESVPFQFTGKGFEYFKIAIVNIILTLLTLGIYSAWAKVRTTQYFYGNTLLKDAGFRYTAKPLTILYGRIIALVAFVVFLVCQRFMPDVASVMMLGLFALMPVIIVRSMAFDLGNSVHRNVRFGFKKDYARAYKVFLLPFVLLFAPILAVVFLVFGGDASANGEVGAVLMAASTLLFIACIPFFKYLATKFMVDSCRYGTSAFQYTGGAGGFYKLYLGTFLVGLVMALIAIAVVMVSGSGATLASYAALAGSQSGAINPILLGASIVPMLLGGLMLLACYCLVFAFFSAKRFNMIYNNSQLDGENQLSANMPVFGLTALYMSNMLILSLTLGLGFAWVRVRSARYQLSHLTLEPVYSLDEYVAAQQSKVGSLGEQMGEVFDMEIGI